MKITASDISLQSSRAFVSERRALGEISTNRGGQQLRVTASNVERREEASVERNRQVRGDFVELTQPRATPAVPQAQIEVDSKELESADPNLELTRQLMEKLLGKKFKLMAFKLSHGNGESQEGGGSAAPAAAAPAGAAPAGRGAPPAGGNGTVITRAVATYEAETTQFSAKGVVQTADGKQIDFNLDLVMDREYTSYAVERVAARATDPPVLNFEGDAAELTDARFTFDLNADGQAEQINYLKPGSAFLSFDKNGNGTIDDGSELFGTQTGDGFAELAAYDEDANGFIDEGDAVFGKLSLYNKDSSGSDQLTSLAGAGVGAIYLKSASTEFSLNKLVDNTKQGQIRSTGVYINENGTVGTVQQVDLVTSAATDQAAASTAEAPAPQGIAAGDPRPAPPHTDTFDIPASAWPAVRLALW